MKTIVIIPSRLSATRLPGKPLLKINGKSIISHVVRKAQEAKIGEVFVAAEDKEIVDDVRKNKGQAILSKKKHKTGTDRVYEALSLIGKHDVDFVMNLQGDEPLMNIEDIRNLNFFMGKFKKELGTLASKILDDQIYAKQSVVKVSTDKNLETSEFPKAINFSRNMSKKNVNVYHHLGIYCYQLETLKKFVSYNHSENEIRNKLEQFRALDNNIEINVALAKSSPIGVDTKEDFLAIKKIMEYKT